MVALAHPLLELKETGGSGVLKHFYYNAQWQVLTETDGTNATAVYSYHPYYIDALALRMRSGDTHFFTQDANFNITAAIKDSSNAVVERYHYSPYGEVTVLDADFSEDADNKSDIGNMFQATRQGGLDDSARSGGRRP